MIYLQGYVVEEKVMAKNKKKSNKVKLNRPDNVRVKENNKNGDIISNELLRPKRRHTVFGAFSVAFIVLLLVTNAFVVCKVIDMSGKLGRLEKVIEDIEEPTEKPTEKQTEEATENEPLVPDKMEEPETKEEITVEQEETIVISKKKVYLTFDDGPSENTLKVLDILDRYDIKATFFVVKANEEYEYIYREIINRGHTLGVHAYLHDLNNIYQSLDTFMTDVSSMRNYLYQVTGVMPKYYRFPGGSSSSHFRELSVYDAIGYINSLGMVHYDWNSSAQDAVAGGISSQEIIDNVFADMGKYYNTVVLMHDSMPRDTTVEALPAIIERLLEEGYEIRAIDEETIPVQHRVLIVNNENGGNNDEGN